jgi:predicted transcriptional regulator
MALTPSYTVVIPLAMKTAVSIPDELFARGESLAKRLGMSRSALYRRALQEFVDRTDDQDITARINAVLKEVGQQPDPLMRRILRRQIRRMEKGE